MEWDPKVQFKKVVMHLDTGSQLQEDLWLTVLDKQGDQICGVPSTALFGWCTDNQGTNAGYNCHSEEKQGQELSCFREISDFVHSEEQVMMVVMIVRQKLKQQNLDSGQQWQLPWVLQLIQQQAGRRPQQQPAGQLPAGGHRDGGYRQEDGQVRVCPHGLVDIESRRMGGASIPKYNDFAQHSSFRNMYEQKRSVLGGGGASLIVQSCFTFRLS